MSLTNIDAKTLNLDTGRWKRERQHISCSGQSFQSLENSSLERSHGERRSSGEPEGIRWWGGQRRTRGTRVRLPAGRRASWNLWLTEARTGVRSSGSENQQATRGRRLQVASSRAGAGLEHLNRVSEPGWPCSSRGVANRWGAGSRARQLQPERSSQAPRRLVVMVTGRLLPAPQRRRRCLTSCRTRGTSGLELCALVEAGGKKGNFLLLFFILLYSFLF